MSGSFGIWWRGRTLREQRLLLFGGALALVVLAWLLVIRPLDDSLSAARERHGEAVAALAETRAEAALVTALDAAPAPDLGGPLDALLMQSASAAGFEVAKVESNGPTEAALAIEAARPQAYFGWIREMESAHGLIVARLDAHTNSDRTLSVSVTFRTRGP